MSEIVIIRDDLHPLLKKIEERILQLGHTATILHWKGVVNFNFSGVKLIYMDRMGETYPTYETQIFYISEIAKREGIKIINDPQKYINARNKILTALYLENNRINIPKTYIVTEIEQIYAIGHKKLICKPYLGACAEGVIPFFVDSIPEEARNILKCDGMIIVQEFIYNPHKYIWRIDIVNGHIIQANQRYSFNESEEFPICNGTQGGEIKVWNPEKIPVLISKMASQVYELMGLKVLGIDILVDETGQLYLLEVNPEPDITCDFVEFPHKIAEYLVQECERRI